MEKTGKVYSEYQDDNMEAWYRVDIVNPNDLESRQIFLSDDDGDEIWSGRSDDDDTWAGGGFKAVFWRERCALPDTRSDVEREQDELQVKLGEVERERDKLNDILCKIGIEVSDNIPNLAQNIRRILIEDGQRDWINSIYWREIPLPGTRSDVERERERERDEFRVELDELRVVIGKIANEVGNPDSDASIRGILLTSMDLLGNAKIY